MSDINIELDKDWATARNLADAKTTQPNAGMGMVGNTTGNTTRECKAPSLMERIESMYYHSREQSRNHDKLLELSQLLRDNPAVARILDLLEDVRLR